MSQGAWIAHGEIELCKWYEVYFAAPGDLTPGEKVAIIAALQSDAVDYAGDVVYMSQDPLFVVYYPAQGQIAVTVAFRQAAPFNLETIIARMTSAIQSAVPRVEVLGIYHDSVLGAIGLPCAWRHDEVSACSVAGGSAAGNGGATSKGGGSLMPGGSPGTLTGPGIGGLTLGGSHWLWWLLAAGIAIGIWKGNQHGNGNQ